MHTVNCPTCQRAVPWSDESPHRPFCSLRCKQADFCAWANEEHVLPAEPDIDDYFSESEQSSARHS